MSGRPEDGRDLRWEKVAERDDLKEGRVRPVTCHHRTVCLTRFEGEVAALAAALAHDGPAVVEIIADPLLI